MLDITLQAAAEQDLIDIWLYTFHKWGERQADLYLDEINRGIQTIAENPRIGMDCGYVRQGYRRFSVNHHKVFYWLCENRIEIIRVLHERMDVEQHL